MAPTSNCVVKEIAILEVVSQPHARSKRSRIGNPLTVINEGTREFGTLISEIIDEEFC